MKTSGMRNPFFSQYRIILQLKDVSNDQTDRQTEESSSQFLVYWYFLSCEEEDPQNFYLPV
jgi:hypothetical protein